MEGKEREYVVDVFFNPGVAVHHVLARNMKEAEEKVWKRIDDGEFVLTQQQKDELIETIMENIESVKCYGREWYEYEQEETEGRQ